MSRSGHLAKVVLTSPLWAIYSLLFLRLILKDLDKGQKFADLWAPFWQKLGVTAPH